MRQLSLKYFPGTPGAMQEAEEKERLGKVKQQAALDKKKEHVSCLFLVTLLRMASSEIPGILLMVQIEASIAEGQRSAKKTGDDNR